MNAQIAQPQPAARRSFLHLGRSLGSTLVTSFIFVAIVPLGIFAAFSLSRIDSQVRDQVVNDLSSVSEIKKGEIQRWLSSGQTTLDLTFTDSALYNRLANVLEIDGDWSGIISILNDYLKQQIALQTVFDTFYVYDLKGNIVVSSSNQLSGSIAALPYFQASLGSPKVHTPYYDPVQKAWFIVVSRPLADTNGKVMGVLGGTLKLDGLNEIMLGHTGLGETGETYLVMKANNYLLTASRFQGYPQFQGYHSTGIDQALDSRNGAASYASYRGTTVIGVYTWIPELQGAMLAEIEENQALQGATEIRNLSIIIAIASFLITNLIGLGITRAITQPITRLTQIASSVIGGDYTQKANIRQNNEIGQLSTAFDTMTTRLAELLSTLESRVANRTRDLRVSAEVSRQVATVLDPQTLLSQLVELTAISFDLYQVSVFLYKPQTETLTLTSASGDAGREMIVQGKHFQLSDHPGLVPFAARTCVPAVSNDVLSDSSHQANVLLPNTRSEAAFPMLLGDKVIGVLDLQSEQVNRFTPNETDVFSLFANQIAVAIRNADLFAQVQTAREQAEQADKTKSAFLASMSHELRTPLNAVINFAKFVSNGVMGPVTEKQVDALGKVMFSANHLLNLINDVLDISKIEAGALQLYVESTVNIKDTLESVVETGKVLLVGKPVEIHLDADDQFPLLTGDQQRIRQILLNLVSNACKFTESGTITISGHQQDDSVLFTVKDTGPGIARDDQEAIFEIFRQSKVGLRQGKGGTGLGLPISKRLTEAHGGRLWLTSELHQGTTFYVLLPIRPEHLKPTVELAEA